MSLFKSSQYFPFTVTSLELIAQDVRRHFEAGGFEVASQEMLGGGWEISIHKGGLFKAILGMKTSLKIAIEPSGPGTLVKAGVGIFGAKAIPATLSIFGAKAIPAALSIARSSVAWPMLFLQAWGLIQQARLDDRAMKCIRQSLKVRFGFETDANVVPLDLGPAFCAGCGAQLPSSALFCAACGTRKEVAKPSRPPEDPAPAEVASNGKRPWFAFLARKRASDSGVPKS
jgi:hypothetical protein